MDKPKFKHGRYQVTRFCCTSGLCVECHSRGNHGNLAKRQRLVQTDNVSRDWSKFVAGNWQAYGATAERMGAMA